MLESAGQPWATLVDQVWCKVGVFAVHLIHLICSSRVLWALEMLDVQGFCVQQHLLVKNAESQMIVVCCGFAI